MGEDAAIGEDAASPSSTGSASTSSTSSTSSTGSASTSSAASSALAFTGALPPLLASVGSGGGTLVRSDGGGGGGKLPRELDAGAGPGGMFKPSRVFFRAGGEPLLKFSNTSRSDPPFSLIAAMLSPGSVGHQQKLEARRARSIPNKSHVRRLFSVLVVAI